MSSKALPKSVRTPLPGFRAVRTADPDQVVEVTMILRRQKAVSDEEIFKLSQTAPTQRTYKTPEELATLHGASAEDIEKVIEFAHEHGLAVVSQSAAGRTVKLSGTVAALQKAFSVDLKIYQDASGKRSYRGRTGPVHLPDELENVVESVHGLDNRDQAKSHFRLVQKPRLSPRTRARARTLHPADVAKAYEFPTATGAGQTIALIELGGGYRVSDLKAYFAKAKANPKVSSVSVHGATNHPTGNPDGPDGEVVLDIEVAGAIAKDSNIVVYFAHNTDKGFLDAINAAIHDQKNKPSIISISWGGPEITWTSQSLDAYNEAFKDAALLGVTVLVASGDDGSSDGVNDGDDHVDFPASSPFVTACGGTRLLTKSGQISDETTWGGIAGDGASGGGESTHFAAPSYQKGAIPATFTGRGVPDVAGDADPQTGYDVLVDGVDSAVGGTSAVAPLYAALVAQLNESLGVRCGFLNPFFYAHKDAFHDITKGTNGTFNAQSGWDPTTGSGSINGKALLKKLHAKKTAERVA
jgi:kumamolisin